PTPPSPLPLHDALPISSPTSAPSASTCRCSTSTTSTTSPCSPRRSCPRWRGGEQRSAAEVVEGEAGEGEVAGCGAAHAAGGVGRSEERRVGRGGGGGRG